MEREGWWKIHWHLDWDLILIMVLSAACGALLVKEGYLWPWGILCYLPGLVAAFQLDYRRKGRRW